MEYLGKLLKIWESFLSFIDLERFSKKQERFCQSLSNLGKLLKIPGKVSFRKYHGKGKGKELIQSFRAMVLL